MKKKKKKVVSSTGITMRTKDNMIELDGAKIKKLGLVPHWQVRTVKETVPMYNDKGEVINVASKFTKESTITFYPDIKEEVKISKLKGMVNKLKGK